MSLNFRGNRLFTANQLKYSNSRKSPAMKMLMGEKRIAKILDKKQEREEIYKMLKEKERGGVTKTEIKELLGDLRMGKAKSIDKGEAAELAKGIFSKSSLGSPYIYRRGKKEEETKPGFTGKELREEKEDRISENETERFHTKYGDIERIKTSSPDEKDSVVPPKNIVRLTGNR
jgi:hypothetical protein